MILNCPFCGAKPEVWERKCSPAKFTIGCPNIECFLFIPEDVHLRKLHNYAPCYVKFENLVEAWNRRT